METNNEMENNEVDPLKKLIKDYRILVNALKAIRTRIDKSDDYINGTMCDCNTAAYNALKMVGECEDE